MSSDPTTPSSRGVVGGQRDPRELAGAMTRSAERLTVTTEVVPYRRAVLRVRTTTEQVMVPVTLTRQVADVEYVDVDPASAVPVGTDPLPHGPAGSWVTLTVDEPVVTTRPVPAERVRLATRWVQATQDVHAELRHEEIAHDLLPAGNPAPVHTEPRSTR